MFLLYCGDVLKRECGFTPNQIISQNFWVSIVDLFGIISLMIISYKIHPLKILKVKLYLFFISLIFFPIMLNYNPAPVYIFIFQCLAALFVFDHVPASPIFYKYFPVFKRFTYTSMISAIAKLFTYLLTSFSLVYITNYLGYWGLFLIFTPVGITFFMAVTYFERMERNQGL